MYLQCMYTTFVQSTSGLGGITQMIYAFKITHVSLHKRKSFIEKTLSQSRHVSKSVYKIHLHLSYGDKI